MDYDESSVSTYSNLTYNYANRNGLPNLTMSNVTPVSDEVGKKLSTDGSFFQFSVSGNVKKGETIPFEITVSKTNSSTLDSRFVKVYLTEVINGKEYPVINTLNDDGTVKVYDDLLVSTIAGSVESKTLYEDSVDYGYNGKVNRNFRLRVWTSSDMALTTGRSFSLKVNVSEKER